MSKIQIREGAFETNSSSAHSLVLAASGSLMPQPFSDAETAQGFVEVSQSEYGWDIETYTSVHDKLSYLYTSTNYGGCGINRVELIKEAVKEHTGLDVVFSSSEGYIDHQSVDVPDAVWVGGKESVKQFLFNPYSKFQTNNDNH